MQSIAVWVRTSGRYSQSYRQSFYFIEEAERGIKRDLVRHLDRRQMGRAIRKCRRIIALLRPVTISG